MILNRVKVRRQMRLRNIYLIMALASLSLQADTVTSTFCNVSPSQNPSDPGSITQSNPTECSVTPQNGARGTAHAFVSAAVSPAGSPSNSSAISISANAISGGLQPSARAEADATGTVSLSLSTGGPSRPGFLVFLENITGGNGPDPLDIATANIAIGQYSASCGAVAFNVTCTTGNLSSFNQKLTETTLPFTLGQSFLFTGQIQLRASSLNPAIAESGQMNSSFQFRFLEADGITPVSVQGFVPEPRTTVLAAIGVLFLFAKVFRNIRRPSSQAL